MSTTPTASPDRLRVILTGGTMLPDGRAWVSLTVARADGKYPDRHENLEFSQAAALFGHLLKPAAPANA